MVETLIWNTKLVQIKVQIYSKFKMLHTLFTATIRKPYLSPRIKSSNTLFTCVCSLFVLFGFDLSCWFYTFSSLCHICVCVCVCAVSFVPKTFALCANYILSGFFSRSHSSFAIRCEFQRSPAGRPRQHLDWCFLDNYLGYHAKRWWIAWGFAGLARLGSVMKEKPGDRRCIRRPVCSAGDWSAHALRTWPRGRDVQPEWSAG